MSCVMSRRLEETRDRATGRASERTDRLKRLLTVGRRGAVAGALTAAVLAGGAGVAGAHTISRPRAASPTTIKMEAFAGSALSWVQYVAQQKGFFARNHLKAQFVTLAGGVSATNALVGGSIDVANVGTLNFAPLLSQGQHFTLLVNDLKTYFGLTVSKALAGKSLAQVMKTVKVVGVPSVGGEAGLLMKYVAQAYGRTSSNLQFAADIPGSGLVGGHEDAIMTTADTQCVLKAQGFPVALSFFNPSQKVSTYPKRLQGLFGASELGFWSSSSWASSHPQAVTEFQDAIEEAIQWAQTPANIKALQALLRKSPYNLSSLNTSQFNNCVANITKGFTAAYSPSSAAIWGSVAKAVGLSNGLPPTKQWFAPGLPAA